jgi:hypothetical protein
MRQLLKLHPDSRCVAAARVEVAVARPRADRLVLSYIVTGQMSDIRMPPVVPAARADNLWQHTCFEAFVRAASGPSYYEFNFASSTEWAAYRFDSYRSGMRAAEIGGPQIEVRSGPDSYTLQASLELDRLPDLSREAVWRLGLSALIEDQGGGMSYWALAHPPGKPDFHHADCFALEFSPAVPS